MLLMFEIFERAKNHGKKFLKLSKTAFSGIINSYPNYHKQICLSDWMKLQAYLDFLNTAWFLVDLKRLLKFV